jgi:hypothetical protein
VPRILAFILVVVLAAIVVAQDEQPLAMDVTVYREPFTLKIKNGKNKFEQHFDKVPYVKGTDIIIFPGEKFGINIAESDGKSIVRYEPEFRKANVTLEFKQEKSMTLLIIKSTLKSTVRFEGVMVVPERHGYFKTSLMPVRAGLSSFESWPHAIIQLILRNPRLG